MTLRKNQQPLLEREESNWDIYKYFLQNNQLKQFK